MVFRIKTIELVRDYGGVYNVLFEFVSIICASSVAGMYISIWILPGVECLLHRNIFAL